MDLIEHRVRERAYHIWEDEGRVHGRAEAHWLRAEAEVAAPAAAEIVRVQAASEASRAPSPAKAVPGPAKVLKPKVARAAKAAVAEVGAKPAAKSAKAAASAGLAKKAPRTPASAAAVH